MRLICPSCGAAVHSAEAWPLQGERTCEQFFIKGATNGKKE